MVLQLNSNEMFFGDLIQNYSSNTIGPEQQLLDDNVENNNGLHVPLISPVQFTIYFSVILTLLYQFRTYGNKDEFDPTREIHLLIQSFHWKQCDYAKLFYTVVCLIGFILILPLLVPLWIGCIIYRWNIHKSIMVNFLLFGAVC